MRLKIMDDLKNTILDLLNSNGAMDDQSITWNIQRERPDFDYTMTEVQTALDYLELESKIELESGGAFWNWKVK